MSSSNGQRFTLSEDAIPSLYLDRHKIDANHDNKENVNAGHSIDGHGHDTYCQNQNVNEGNYASYIYKNVIDNIIVNDFAENTNNNTQSSIENNQNASTNNNNYSIHCTSSCKKITRESESVRYFINFSS